MSDILFEDVSVGDPDTVTSPWAIKFKVSQGQLTNITFRRIRIGRIGNTPWMYVTFCNSFFYFDGVLSRPLSLSHTARTVAYRPSWAMVSATPC